MSKHKHRGKISDKYDNNSLNINPELFKMLGLNEIDDNALAQMMSSIKQENFNMDSMNNILQDLLLKNSTNNNMPDISNLANMLSGSMKGSNNIGNMLASLLSGGFNNNFMAEDMNSNNNGLNENLNNNNSKVRLNLNNDNLRKNSYNDRIKTNTNISDKDDKIRMLSSLKNFVDEDKIRFLDKVIEMYKKGEIIYR